jgi:hypothetical protein
VEAQVCAQVSPCWIFGGQSCTGTVFSLSSMILPCYYHSIFSLMCHLGMNSRPEIQRVALYEIPMDLEVFNTVRCVCVSQLLWFLYTAILRLTLLICLGKTKR